jgi:hypothetical protein
VDYQQQEHKELLMANQLNIHDPTILVGANESYEPRSRHYHEVPGKPKKNKYMNAALREAKKAENENEVPVGAVVVYKIRLLQEHIISENKTRVSLTCRIFSNDESC